MNTLNKLLFYWIAGFTAVSIFYGIGTLLFAISHGETIRLLFWIPRGFDYILTKANELFGCSFLYGLFITLSQKYCLNRWIKRQWIEVLIVFTVSMFLSLMIQNILKISSIKFSFLLTNNVFTHYSNIFQTIRDIPILPQLIPYVLCFSMFYIFTLIGEKLYFIKVKNKRLKIYAIVKKYVLHFIINSIIFIVLFHLFKITLYYTTMRYTDKLFSFYNSLPYLLVLSSIYSILIIFFTNIFTSASIKLRVFLTMIITCSIGILSLPFLSMLLLLADYTWLQIFEINGYFIGFFAFFPANLFILLFIYFITTFNYNIYKSLVRRSMCRKNSSER